MRPFILRPIIVILGFAASGLLASDRATITGKIVDSAGHAIDHATVLIYQAGVKKGYSIFCPSCYVDCGKKASTGPDGSFVIRNVDSNLLFELLAVRDGFQPAFIKRVDSLSRSTVTAALVPRIEETSPENVVRGRVVDDHGIPVRDSLVEPIGVSSHYMPAGQPSKEEVSQYGGTNWADPAAVTDEKGEFEIASQRPALAMLLKFEARGFALKVQALPTGLERKTVIVSPGAVVRGRLMDHGTPVAGAEIGLIPRHRGAFGANLKIYGDPYEEIRVGTQADGSFVLADVPAAISWYVYPKMESLQGSTAAPASECETKKGGEVVDVGDIQLERGHRVAGKVLLPNGATIADGMRILISSTHAWDSQLVSLSQDGSFECNRLATGSYDITPSVRGYRAAEELKNITIDHDIDGLKIMLASDSHP